MQAMLADGIDRMKTSQGDVPVIAVGGGHFLVGDALSGVAQVLRPPHAAVANAVGAAIAQIGAQIEQIVDYDVLPRTEALDQMRRSVYGSIAAAGGGAASGELVVREKVFLVMPAGH